MEIPKNLRVLKEFKELWHKKLSVVVLCQIPWGILEEIFLQRMSSCIIQRKYSFDSFQFLRILKETTFLSGCYCTVIIITFFLTGFFFQVKNLVVGLEDIIF
eukprot:TRINITY_DN1025_c1_g1_i11.p4 TRINITY_DN1025_c1_g1~~TRINITY_DN1025_c1_g1_i11.p4  ORF type:complete len:102 (-),score=10.94 TRINITY_DN1025_c1_g1_i11:242-547(-)